MTIRSDVRCPRAALGLAAAALLLGTGPLQAAGFATFNQAALARGHALPALGQAPLASGERHWSLALDFTNEFHEYPNPPERILLDGESQRWALALRQGFGEGWDWGLELPLIHQGGGALDGFIEDWHGWFGLPNGGREAAPQDRYGYRYERDGTVVLDRAEGGTGLGDLRVQAGRQLSPALALRGLVQLPTGDETRLSGGGTGAALWADYAFAAGADAPLSGFVAAGLSLNDRSGALAGLQEPLVPFGGAGAFWHWSAALQLGAQVYAHAPLHDDSELEALRRPGLQLALGGRHRVGRGWLDLAIVEDLVTRSSPDFSVHLALRLQ